MSFNPLDQIMTTLRGHGAIDPNQASHRQAQMKQMQGQFGVAPATPRPRTPATTTPDTVPGTSEEGLEGHIQVASQDMAATLADQMNEAILTIKIQLSRETDSNRKRLLEKQAQTLRKQIQELGYEPIWPDESVEEGLEKLKGHGYIGFERVMQAVGGQPEGPFGPMGSQVVFDYLPSKPQAQQTQATQKPASQGVTLPQNTFGFQGQYPVLDNLPSKPQQQQYKPATQPQPQPQPQDEFSKILADIGAQKAVTSAPPSFTVDADYVNQLMQQYGLQPRSPEAIAEHARAIVERQALERSQLVQRELDRFNERWPEQFERAQSQIKEAAAKMSAERQEEFAARGAFYSSVMANSLGEIDQKTMELIGDIARDAADYVTQLEAELRDIAEWAILEQEVVRRQLEAEDRAMRERLMGIHLEVAMRAEQMALDRWYKEQQIAIQQHAQRLQEMQMARQQAMEHNQFLGLAFLANSPTVQEQLRRMGISPQQWQEMPLEQQAMIVNSAIDLMGLEHSLWQRDVEAHMIAAEASGLPPSQVVAMIDTKLLPDLRKAIEETNSTEAQRIANEIRSRLQFIFDPKLRQHYEYQLNTLLKTLEQQSTERRPGAQQHLFLGPNVRSVIW